MSTLVVGTVQFAAEPCKVERNLSIVGELVAEAAARGAQLICLPELTPGGYLLTSDIWKCAERSDGRATSWLLSTAQKHNVYLGMSYLEAEGEHFYNTFVLAGPDGVPRGSVRKNPPASAETALFAPGEGSHVIETEIGRIGVLICYEALLHERLAELHANSVDIVLIPMSAGTPTPAFPIRQRDCETYNAMLAALAAHHASALGVPVVMANKCGPLITRMPKGMPAQDTYFPGLSTIADSDGRVCIQLAGEQGVGVQPVHLEEARKKTLPPRAYRRWALPVPWFSFLFPLVGRFCAREYSTSSQRARAALAVSTDA